MLLKLYKEIWYPKKKIKIHNQNIVDILTLEQRSSIRKSYYDEDFQRQDSKAFAINYAWRKGDRSPVLRGFKSEDKLYEIDSSNKILLVQPIFGQLFYDQDKIDKNEFIFEGTLENFIGEFIKSGYKLENKMKK